MHYGKKLLVAFTAKITYTEIKIFDMYTATGGRKLQVLQWDYRMFKYQERSLPVMPPNCKPFQNNLLK